MDRASKFIVLVSTAAALVCATSISAAGWGAAWRWTGVCFVGAALISLLIDELAAAIVVGFAYILPALFGGPLAFLLGYNMFWGAVLLGAMLPRSLGAGWAYPRRWKAPLVLWALTIALTWPVVVLR